MKRAILISALGLTAGLMSLAYGAWGPWYPTTPLKQALSFSTQGPQEHSFRVWRSHDYLVEVHFRKPSDPDDLIPILGDYTRQHVGGLDIAWEVLEKNKVVAHGTNLEYGYSPIFGSTHDGVVVGSFTAYRGTKYVLRVSPGNHEPGWNLFDPYVAVNLHPANLEYLLGHSLIGAPITFVSGTALLCCMAVFLVRFVRRPSSVSASGI
jgi:hypothetical protein